MTYSTSIKAIITAARSLFGNRRSLLLMLAVYAGLLAAIYLFVSTREATVSQLVLTLVTFIGAPALFFVLQAAIVGPTSRGLMKRSVKLVVVSVPVVVLIVGAAYALSKFQTHPAIVMTVRYLVWTVVVPLLVVQLWIAVSNGGVRVREVFTRAFAPQSVFVYACGFLIFAVAPYWLLHKPIPAHRPWLEISLIVARLSLTALLILLGWALTIRTLSILHTRQT
jgi:hypothetical protein